MWRTCWSERWKRAAKVMCWPWRKRNSWLNGSQHKLYLKYRKEPVVLLEFCGVKSKLWWIQGLQVTRDSFFSASLQENSRTAISSRCVAQRYLSPQQSFTIMNLNQQGSQLSLSLVHQRVLLLTFYILCHQLLQSPWEVRRLSTTSSRAQGSVCRRTAQPSSFLWLLWVLLLFFDHRRGWLASGRRVLWLFKVKLYSIKE